MSTLDRVGLRALGLALAATALVAAGCGGSGSGGGSGDAAVVETVETSAQTAPAPPGSIQARLNEAGGDVVAIVMGSADFAVGENRVRFLLIGNDGQPVDAKRARVLAARGGFDAKPTIEGTAEELPVGATSPQGGEEFDTSSVWVAELSLDEPGPYTLLVEPEGVSLVGVGQIEVRKTTEAPAVGTKAIPVDNPTVADDFPEKITTATPPDVDLLQSSVADALADHAPFVVTFATPKYCQSRVCGPVVDVVEAVRKRFEGTPVRFIHVEIYENNDPGQGFNRWVRAWHLPTEPWTFVVDSTGTIRAAFEGLVTVGELEQAVKEYLLQ
jgi:hypothetical protein